METDFNISNAELVVMRVIWSLGEARVDEISGQISHDLDWSLATVKTLLGRLVKKGILSTEKEGRKFVYHPLLKECDAINLMGKSLLGKVCATKQSQLLSDMINLSVLTESDIKILTDALAQKATVDQVECTCLEDFGACSCMHVHHMEDMKV